MSYLTVFLSGLILSAIFTPLLRYLAIHYGIFDQPISNVKTHKVPTPYLGGLAIFLAFTVTLILLRLLTHFPTGTLRALRAVVIGSTAIVLLGLVDDLKPDGLNYKLKFVIQIVVALLLISYEIKIKFTAPRYFADLITILWVVGIINAINIIDIMDGLAVGVSLIAFLAFFFIALVGEQIYVNYASIALAGSCLGFLPYNLSQRYKIFMGDTGSLFLGFLLATISLGTTYTKVSELALYAPLVILAVPLYDTLFVMFMRIRQGKSPFLGSKDHFALRLEALGYSRKKILFLAYLVSLVLAFLAWLITRVKPLFGLSIYILVIILFVSLSVKLQKVKME